MSLKIGCLISNQGITCSVRFVEGILGEVFHCLVQVFSNLLINIVFYASFNKFFTHLFHQCGDLFTHGFTQGISLATGKASHIFGHLHDLFLVDDNAISIFERCPCLLVNISNWLLPMFTGNEFIDPLHWTRAIERDHGDNVFEN
ncbi:MAG: hypothetical protein BWY68_00765 [bacterium ADurb.Bin400]|nr:MAG: hypothetical protein BWY68_00765 [bacterium ADurb.Bin400]